MWEIISVPSLHCKCAVSNESTVGEGFLSHDLVGEAEQGEAWTGREFEHPGGDTEMTFSSQKQGSSMERFHSCLHLGLSQKWQLLVIQRRKHQTQGPCMMKPKEKFSMRRPKQPLP